MNGNFVKNTKLFKYVFKDNFLLFLIFGIVFVVICIGTSFLCFIGDSEYAKLPILTPIQVRIVSGDSYYTTDATGMPISSTLSQFFFGTAGILTLTIFMVIALTKNFSGQVKNTSMSSWLSLPYSRNKIVLSKLFAILSYIWLLIIFCSLYFVVFALTGTYRNLGDIGRMFAWGMEYVAFMTFIFAILSIIQISLIKSRGIALGISIALIAYIFVISTLASIGSSALDAGLNSSNSSYPVYKALSNLTYISPKSLFVNPLLVTSLDATSFDEKTNIGWNVPITDATWKLISFPIIELAVSAGLIAGSTLIFKNKNLSI